jgi:hypothetical protein
MKVLAVCFLKIPVLRPQKIQCINKPNATTSYEQLETEGLIAISGLSNRCIVDIPFIYLEQYIKLMNGASPKQIDYYLEKALQQFDFDN